MAEKVFHCDTCDVHLTGPQPAMQHYDGRKHRKKETMKLAQSGIMFSNPDDMKYAAAAGRHTEPVNLPGPAAYSEETSLKSVETTPACSVVMVPSRNPNLPPVPVTMTENVLPQSEYEMHGSSGSCHLCGVELSSQQHAEQHLSGQKHLKAKKRWEQRREQLQTTVSRLSPSMQSKPIAMCQPLVCDTATKSFGDAISLVKLSSDRQLPSIDIVDHMQWFNCDVCNKKMNTAEMLELHRRSPAHLKKVEQQQLRPLSGDNTIWQICPVCGKKLNSLIQLDIHVKSHNLPRDTGNQPNPVCTPNTQEMFRNLGAKITESEPSSSSTESCQKVDVTNLVEIVRQLRMKELESVDTATKTNVEMPQASVNLAVQTTSEAGVDSVNAVEGGHGSRVVVDDDDGGNEDEDEAMRLASVSSKAEQTADNLETATSHTDSGMMNTVTNVAAEEDADRLFMDDDLITTGCCASPGCFYHCELCDVHLNSDDTKTMHLTGTKHISCRQRAQEITTDKHNPFSPQFRYHCPLCNVPFNTLRDKKQHERGQQHTGKSIRSVQAPERLLPDVVLPADGDESVPDGLVSSKPRSYQEELYFKTMAADSICFLPTGTGKTLVAVMLMSRLLSLNPHHSVVFVVDRILLALQQKQLIVREIADQLFDRWNEQQQVIERRRVRVAMLCGGRGDLHGTELWQQDIIVITAAYYVNLLEIGSVRWTDNCLVVIDEVHHCLKDHPYRRLIQLCRHPDLSVAQRPRLLGLTASPAGRETPAATITMLRQLLDNVGVERLVTVERNVDELARYQSTAALDIRLITYSASEQELRSQLRLYALHCYRRLSELSHGDELSHFGPTLDDWQLDQEAIQCLSNVVDTAKPKYPESRLLVSFLGAHLKVLFRVVETLDCLGLENAYNELAVLLGPDFVASFRHAEEAGLPVAELKTLVSGYMAAENKSAVEVDATEAMKKSASYIQLVHELVTWCDSAGHGEGMALVLVRKRSTASLLAKLLGCCPSLQKRGITVALVTGHHGGGGTDPGMSVRQQDRRLQDIQRRHYNVIVATSVAEEGVDLPDCDLVIQMDAPDCVRAVVQVRGRARRPGSRFIAFCCDAAQKSQLSTLLLHEQHMIEAVSQIIHNK